MSSGAGWGRRFTELLILGLVLMLSDTVTASAQTAQQWMSTMIDHENAATNDRGRYIFLNQERSERSGGHVWLEWVAETDWGKVRYLIAEDGKPLSPDRVEKEKARLTDEALHPDAFKKAEDGKADSEKHAREMLALLPRAFLLSEPKMNGDVVRIDFTPNPQFQPSTIEEKVIHAMSGTLLIDERMIRMRQLQGHMSQDVSFALGIATIKAGTSFLTERVHAVGPDWKVGLVQIDVRGKALLFKIARSQDSKHTQFQQIPEGMTVGAAVELLEHQKQP